MTDFEEIYATYFDSVYQYVLSLCRDVHTAEEVTQESFCKAMTHLDRFDGRCRLYVWLCQIAKNTWLTALRRQKRVAPLPSDPAGTDDHSCEWLDLVEKLEEPYRTVFLKRALGDCPYSTLAREYGRSKSWARVTFHRARMRILQMLSEEEKNHG